QQAAAVAARGVGVDAAGQAGAQGVGIAARDGVGERCELRISEGMVQGGGSAARGRARRQEEDQDTAAHGSRWYYGRVLSTEQAAAQVEARLQHVAAEVGHALDQAAAAGDQARGDVADRT